MSTSLVTFGGDREAGAAVVTGQQDHVTGGWAKLDHVAIRETDRNCGRPGRNPTARVVVSDLDLETGVLRVVPTVRDQHVVALAHEVKVVVVKRLVVGIPGSVARFGARTPGWGSGRGSRQC